MQSLIDVLNGLYAQFIGLLFRLFGPKQIVPIIEPEPIEPEPIEPEPIEPEPIEPEPIEPEPIEPEPIEPEPEIDFPIFTNNSVYGLIITQGWDSPN
jgi:hypothetical protein